MLSTSDIRPYVEAVLRAADNCLSAYQILNRLSAEIREQLITERGLPGLGGGNSFTAATLITTVAESIIPSNDPPHRIYIDSVGMTFRIGDREITAGSPAIAVYRLRPMLESE